MFRKKVRTILKAWIRATCYFQMEVFSTLLALLVTVHQNIYNLEVMKKFKYELQSEFGNIFLDII